MKKNKRKKIIRELKKSIEFPLWALLLILFLYLGIVMIIENKSYFKGLEEGQKQFYEETLKEQKYQEYISKSFEERKKEFFSSIMFDIKENKKFFWTIIVIFFLLLAVRL